MVKECSERQHLAMILISSREGKEEALTGGGALTLVFQILAVGGALFLGGGVRLLEGRCLFKVFTITMLNK